jgi:hypothetical protein
MGELLAVVESRQVAEIGAFILAVAVDQFYEIDETAKGHISESWS